MQAVTRDVLDEATAKARATEAVLLVAKALPSAPQEHANWLKVGELLPHALAVTQAAEQHGIALEAAATILNAVALYHHARAAWPLAKPLYERALAIREKALDPDHPDVAGSLNDLGMLYGIAGPHTKAEPLLKRALAIREKALGPDHPDVAQSP